MKMSKKKMNLFIIWAHVKVLRVIFTNPSSTGRNVEIVSIGHQDWGLNPGLPLKN
jgi:hypothetical protein